VSLDLNSIGGFPQASAFGAIRPSQAKPESVSAPPVAKPESQPVAERTAPAADFSKIDFAAAAKMVAAAVSESDPVKPFAEGVAEDLSEAGSDVFEAMGRMNDLQNALSFALESSSSMMVDPSLEAIS
tara:strand:+ start:3023 stop:3406 length:384 start_codon:yes stop_codon:yes gene_type:complete